MSLAIPTQQYHRVSASCYSVSGKCSCLLPWHMQQQVTPKHLMQYNLTVNTAAARVAIMLQYRSCRQALPNMEAHTDNQCLHTRLSVCSCPTYKLLNMGYDVLANASSHPSLFAHDSSCPQDSGMQNRSRIATRTAFGNQNSNQQPEQQLEQQLQQQKRVPLQRLHLHSIANMHQVCQHSMPSLAGVHVGWLG